MGISSFLASLYFICGAVIFFTAITILRYSSRDIVGWATVLVLLFAGTGPLLGALGVVLRSNLQEGRFLFRSLIDSFDYTWEFFFPSLVLFALVYPVRHTAWRYIRKISFLLFVPHFFHLILVIFLLDKVNPDDIFSFLRNISFLPDTLKYYADQAAGFMGVMMGILFKAHTRLFSIVNISYAAFSMVLLVRSSRKEIAPRARRQTAFVLGGLGICVAAYSLGRFVPIFFGADESSELTVAFVNASLVVGGGTIAYAIVRYRFLDIKIIARRGIFFTGITTIIAALYLITIKRLISYISGFSDLSIEIIETGLVVIFIVIYLTLMSRIEEWIEKMSAREGKNPRERIQTLSNELLSIVDLESMKNTISGILSDLFEATSPEIVMRDEIHSMLEGEYSDRMKRFFAENGEPIGRLDFIEAMGFDRPRGKAFLRPTEREIESAVNRLPPGIKWLASYELIVPVVRDDYCAALLLLGVHEQRGRYSIQEIAMLSMLASQIAASLSRIELLEEVVEKRVIEEELNIARSIQLNLLPSCAPVIDRYEASGVSVPSKQVGGDYFDYIQAEGLFAFAVADVAGKGVPASLLMASLQASLRSLKDKIEDPVTVVSSLNQVMFEITSVDKFATLFYGCVNLKKNKLIYSNAGHFFPVVIRAGGWIEELDYSGLILGVQEEFEYESLTLKIEPGDVLVVTTDGVIEAENDKGDFYGEGRLHRFLLGQGGKSADQIKEALVKDVESFASARKVRDDMTILILKRKS